MKTVTLIICMLSFILSGCAQANATQAAQVQALQVEAPVPAAQASATPTQPAVSNVSVETPQPEAGEPASGGPCSNPYYPVVDGATWVYDMVGDSQAVHTMSVEEEGKFKIAVVSADATSILEGLCSEEGLVLMDRGMEGSFFTESGSSSTTTLSQEGVTLPNDIQVGDSWSQTIDMTAEGGDGGISMEARIVTNYSVMGIETVKVPAGTFEALKIEQSGSITMSGHEFTTKGTLWYAKGVGNVQSENGMAGGEMYLVQLISYEIP